MSRLKTTARRLDTPPAIRHFLLTGVFDHDLDGGWDLWELLCAPLGSSRAEQAAWDADAALEPYREALRAEGVTLFEDETEEQ